MYLASELLVIKPLVVMLAFEVVGLVVSSPLMQFLQLSEYF